MRKLPASIQPSTFLFLIGALVPSCGGTATESSPGKDTLSVATAAVANAPIPSRGQSLIAKADCSGCHQPLTRVVGPGYNETAKKYDANTGNISKLAANIINGVASGNGVWGQLPMTALPQLSRAEIFTGIFGLL